MCRIAGYLGHPIALDALLVRPTRSLAVQARCPRELPPGMIGSDGFGFGWFAEHDGRAARYRSTLPIWVDENVDDLSPHLRSSCIVASSRTASRKMPVSMTNTPPFKVGRALLVHNGAIDDFHEKVLERLRAPLGVDTRSQIYGNTDTEYLAAVMSDGSGDLSARVLDALRSIGTAIRDAGTTGQLNVIVGDGEQLVVTRYAVGVDAPSLWVRSKPGSFTVASEPMNDDDDWTQVAPDTLLVARRDAAAAPIETRISA
jgi:glutamine amidotransferase